jgi:hypothetical protein
LTVSEGEKRDVMKIQASEYSIKYLPKELYEKHNLSRRMVAVLHLTCLPEAELLTTRDMADIIRIVHSMPCTFQAVAYIRTSARFNAALAAVQPYIADISWPLCLMKQRNLALEGDGQAFDRYFKASGHIKESKQLTGNTVVLIGDDLAKQGFGAIMDSLSGKRQIAEADAEVIDDDE